MAGKAGAILIPVMMLAGLSMPAAAQEPRTHFIARFAPVAAARATRDLLAGAGRGNFTYREYEGYDHFMVDAAGTDHRREVLAATARWLRGLAGR